MQQIDYMRERGLELQLVTLEDTYDRAVFEGTEIGLLACGACYQLIPLCNCKAARDRLHWPIEHVINKLKLRLA